MDGFAVRAVDGPHTDAPVSGESRAGAPFGGRCGPGTVVRIATGGVLPEGLDSVVRVEDAVIASDGRVSLPAVARGAEVRGVGEDLQSGEVVVSAGTRLAAHHLAAIAGAGVGEVICRRRPVVSVVITGDEVVPPGRAPGPGQVTDVHGFALPPLVEAAGGVTGEVLHVRDDAQSLVAALEGLAPADIVLVTGGLSVGEHDHTRAAIAGLGAELLVPRLALRPGQPTAVWSQPQPRRLWFGLPGNPAAAFAIARLFVVPALAALAGADPRALQGRTRLLAAASGGDPRRWMAARATFDGDTVSVIERQGSHMVSGLAAGDGLALIPPSDQAHPAGTPVETLSFLPAIDR